MEKTIAVTCPSDIQLDPEVMRTFEKLKSATIFVSSHNGALFKYLYVKKFRVYQFDAYLEINKSDEYFARFDKIVGGCNTLLIFTRPQYSYKERIGYRLAQRYMKATEVVYVNAQ